MKEEAIRYYGDMGRIASTITRDRTLRDDLIQEGAISLLEAPAENKKSWYLQRAKRGMLNYLNRGKSIDSKRREGIKVLAFYNREGEPMEIEDRITARDRIDYDDLKERITGLLTKEELEIVELKEKGFNNREIARKFSITRQAIEKRLKKIKEMVASCL